MPTPQLYYIRVKLGEINGFLQAQGGQILHIMNNYTEVFPTPPRVTDDSLQVFAVKIHGEDIRNISDGGIQKIFLWRGDKTSRVKPQDKITAQIFTTEEVKSMPAPVPADVTAAARETFASYPADVQLALVIAAQEDSTLTTLPNVSPALATAFKNWAQVTINGFVAAQAPATASAAG